RHRRVLPVADRPDRRVLLHRDRPLRRLDVRRRRQLRRAVPGPRAVPLARQHPALHRDRAARHPDRRRPRQPAQPARPAVRRRLPGAVLPALRGHADGRRHGVARHLQRRLRHPQPGARRGRHRGTVLDLDARAATVAVAVVGLWSSLGFSMIVLAAGLKSIPPELYEAAELDGATRWRQFRAITVPLLTPSIFFVLIITVIASFQVFDLLYAILGSSNPVLPRSMSLVYFFYREGFVANDKGYAAAIAMVIFLLIGLLTALQFRLQRRWVHSD